MFQPLIATLDAAMANRIDEQSRRTGGAPKLSDEAGCLQIVWGWRPPVTQPHGAPR